MGGNESKYLSHSVAVIGIGNVSVSEFCSILVNFGIQIKNDNTSVLDVVLIDDYLHPDILEIHKKNLETRRPWMLIKPNGYQIWLGPIFNTLKKAGCYLCLKKRVEINQIERTLITLKKNLKRPPSLSAAKLPLTFDLASVLMAVEIKRYLQNPKDHSLNGKILTMNTLKWSTRYHHVLIEEDCSHCKSQGLDKIWHYVSPISGVISQIKTYKLPGCYVCHTSFNTPDQNHNILKETDQYRIVCAGKGFRRSKAKLIAVSEALERYSGFFKGNEVRIVDSLQGLGSKAIHPNDCMLYSQTQYQQRNAINNKGNPFNQIPLPFNENQEIEWSPVYSLTQNQEFYLPTQFLYYKYHSHPLKLPNSPLYCQHDSNGNAAHFNYESAILHGLFELVERDAVALWWYNRLSKPQVNIKNFKDEAIDSFIKEHTSLGREFWVLDLTTDLEIPVFTAISCRKKEESEIVFGFGCHLNPKIALKSALLEMNQMLLMERFLNKKDEKIIIRKEIQEWLKFSNLKNQSYLKPNNQYQSKFDIFLSSEEEMLKFSSILLKRKGINILLLDQTRPSINLKVLKVIVPGLRHFWPRFAIGRLYEVPVKMGWLPKALQESELNPIDFFL